jgi:hypothetical protein
MDISVMDTGKYKKGGITDVFSRPLNLQTRVWKEYMF